MKKLFVIFLVIFLVFSVAMCVIWEIYADNCNHKDINVVLDTENSENTMYFCIECDELIPQDMIQFRRKVKLTTKALWMILFEATATFGAIAVYKHMNL